MPSHLWASRFTSDLDGQALTYTETTLIDARLVKYDLLGSIAHSLMLTSSEVIGSDDGRAIIGALLELVDELSTSGRIDLDPKLEDVHFNIEARLIDRVGIDRGGYLHTARSRNDQVVLDTRLYLREALLNRIGDTLELCDILLERAQDEAETFIVGHTHSQSAQPISVGYWLCSYATAFSRDARRLYNAFATTNVCPLGAGALAGTSFDIDPDLTARLLGFPARFRNGLDATSSRDFVIEAAAALAILFNGISRLAEELVLWSGQEFGRIKLPEAFATGSSIMPQKRNPVVPELARSRSGLAASSLVELLFVTKSVASGYSCDLQQDKPPLWRSLDESEATLNILKPMIAGAEFTTGHEERKSLTSFATATELANMLVRDFKLSFRMAYRVVGNVVRSLEVAGEDLGNMVATQAALLGEGFQTSAEWVSTATQPRAVLHSHRSPGGTAPAAVNAAISLIRADVHELRRVAEQEKQSIEDTLVMLVDAAREFSINGQILVQP